MSSVIMYKPSGIKTNAHYLWCQIRKIFSDWKKDRQAYRRFWGELDRYNKMLPVDKRVDRGMVYPCLNDRNNHVNVIVDYFYQDAWAFEKIVSGNPSKHVDIGSHHKFVSLLSKVVSVTMVDLRPLPVELDSLDFRCGTILDLPYESHSLESVSSLCVVEHIGLGRYGDILDPKGTEKAIDELKRVLQPGGNLYISVPVDTSSRTVFNAHRVFFEQDLLGLVSPLELLDSAYIYKREFCDTWRPGYGIGCYHFCAVS